MKVGFIARQVVVICVTAACMDNVGQHYRRNRLCLERRGKNWKSQSDSPVENWTSYLRGCTARTACLIAVKFGLYAGGLTLK